MYLLCSSYCSIDSIEKNGFYGYNIYVTFCCSIIQIIEFLSTRVENFQFLCDHYLRTEWKALVSAMFLNTARDREFAVNFAI